MSCLYCNAKYGLFNKEAGCSNCGVSLCHKCLKHKYKVPATGKETKICGACYTKLTKGIKTDTEERPPPDVFLKRLANLQSSKLTTASDSNNPQGFKPGLSPADQQIVQRLEKLKAKDNQKVLLSDDEIRKRLDNLKGETTKATIIYDPKAVDTRSDQEKIDSLLEQYASEINIKEDHESTKDLEERIAKLKGEKTIKEKQKLNDEDDEASDEEVEAEKVAKKVMSQIALENKSEAKSMEKDNALKFEEELEEDEPELPWCVLCNADAQLRCLDCKDLYCARCCKEAHKEWGDDDHEIIKYKRK
ncbi:abscission/NoCut checkpoint regulator [Agrilus planipennis]|uniref:Abscission/NoCut checkpoint regulator n=1 Tax=Agrilus planipennis TaxID=224129 RepID=A0A7F5R6Q4_AGRPL|nr:abscission/NoCut checkpoint regulator [Agrilus planipennis]